MHHNSNLIFIVCYSFSFKALESLIFPIFYYTQYYFHDILISVFSVSFNGPEPPQLGDRVVNLYATGVPFGLRGTIVAIHSNTGYTEVNILD